MLEFQTCNLMLKIQSQSLVLSKFSKKSFLVENLCFPFLQQWFIISFYKSNFIAITQPLKNYVGEYCSGYTQKTNLRHVFFNVGGCKNQISAELDYTSEIQLKSLRRTILRRLAFLSYYQGKAFSDVFIATYLKWTPTLTISRNFLAKNPCDCNQIKSNQIQKISKRPPIIFHFSKTHQITASKLC